MSTLQDYQAAGFSDEEIGQWAAQQRQKYSAAGFTDQEISNHLTGINLPDKPPDPFLARVTDGKDPTFGQRIGKVITNAADLGGMLTPMIPSLSALPSFGSEFSQALHETGNQLFHMFVDAAKPQAYLEAAEQLVNPPQLEDPKSGRQLTPEEIKAQTPTREQATQFGLMHIIPHTGWLGRNVVSPDGVPLEEAIGRLPSHLDFVDASTALSKGTGPLPHVEQKLVDLYTEHGIHPSEVVADAARDPTVAQELLSLNPGLPARYVGEETARPPLTIEEVPDTADGILISSQNIPGEPPIVRFRRDAAAIEAALPLVEEGYTRLWRGNRPGEIGTGQQFTSDLPGIALPFREPYGGDISYVDVPTADLSKYENRFGAGGVEFYLTPEMAKAAKQVGVTTEPRALPLETQRGLPPAEPPVPPRGEGGGAGGPPEPPRIEPPTIEGEPPPPPAPREFTSEEARDEILSKISIGEQEPKRGWSLSRLYTDIVDRLNPLKRLTKGLELSAAEDPYALFRMLMSSATKAHEMLMGNGPWAFGDPGAGPVGRSLRQILEPVRNIEDLKNFRAFAAASRALELARRGIESPFDRDAALKVVADHAERMQPVLDELVGFQNNVSAWLRDTHVISPEAYKAMLDLNSLYVPFYRVMDEPLAHGPGGSLMVHDPLKRIMGSTEGRVIDPIESIIKNTHLYLSMAERNHAATTLIDMLEKKGEAPIIERDVIPATAPKDAADFAAWLEHYGVPKATADELTVAIQTAAVPVEGEGTIAVIRDGKRTLHAVDDEVARAVRGLDSQTITGLQRFLGGWSGMLRAGATLVPEFGARHLMRDFLYAFVTAKGGIFSPHWMVRGIMHAIKQDEVYRQWQRSGGANVTYQAFDRSYLQEDIRTLTNETGLMIRAWNVVASPELSLAQKAGIAFNAAIHPLQVITELAQSASHIGAFERALTREGETPPTREQMINAGWESRETAVDISRRGAKTQAFNLTRAFANATVQDTDRWVRAFRERPATTAFRVAAGITAPTVLLWAAQHDDPIYQEIPRWQKDLFWNIIVSHGNPNETVPPSDPRVDPYGGQFDVNAFRQQPIIFRVPKPWGMGLIFGSGVERMLEALYAQKPDAFKGFLTSLMETNFPSLVPTPFVPFAEDYFNKSFLTGRPLVPHGMEKILPEYQYAEYTTETAKALGHLLGEFHPGGVVSPMVIENYIAGWTGRLGQYALEASDLALRKSGVLPDPPKPASTLADIPVIKAFITRYPSATTQSIEDFREEYNKRATIYNTWQAMAQRGDVEALARIQQIGGTGMFVRLTAFEKALSVSQQLVQNVSRNPDMSPSDKRQLIDKTYYEMILLARQANQIMYQTR